MEKKQGWITVGELEGCVHYKVGTRDSLDEEVSALLFYKGVNKSPSDFLTSKNQLETINIYVFTFYFEGVWISALQTKTLFIKINTKNKLTPKTKTYKKYDGKRKCKPEVVVGH